MNRRDYIEAIDILTENEDVARKAIFLLRMFMDVDLATIMAMTNSNAGKLALYVLKNNLAGDTTIPCKEMVDELIAEWKALDTGTKFVTRQALMDELADVLKTKSISVYRRSRINKALKRECIQCFGSGRIPKKVIRDEAGRRIIRFEIASNYEDCPRCEGTGIEPEKT